MKLSLYKPGYSFCSIVFKSDIKENIKYLEYSMRMNNKGLKTGKLYYDNVKDSLGN